MLRYYLEIQVDRIFCQFLTLQISLSIEQSPTEMRPDLHNPNVKLSVLSLDKLSKTKFK